MAKAPKVAKVAKVAADATPSLATDTKMIARDFAVFGKWTFNNDVRDAMLRRVTDPKVFNEIRLGALTEWLVGQRGYDATLARQNVDKHAEGALENPAAFGKTKPKRSAEQQKDYKDATGAWQYYLTLANIESLTRKKSEKKATRAPRTPMGANVPDAPKVTQAPAALSAVVPLRGDINAVVAQFANMAALASRIVKENAKTIKGDKGAALRALETHIAKETARIAAMAD